MVQISKRMQKQWKAFTPQFEIVAYLHFFDLFEFRFSKHINVSF